ncbi:hypothetical protein JD844_024926 [Phrynosoma platyrhinos]|uniref:Adenylosuccinate synthetase n=1 Tax=Phrynosoma platyrhinos TaxID=52577 RepID=A0ABQ7SYR5_PHRPL|nr:hypothetical protein JD844_024926 [Phrynosoma platyrhinos]
MSESGSSPAAAAAAALPNGGSASQQPGNKVTVVLGAQWGDEGKGKVVDLLAQDADIVCRCQMQPRTALDVAVENSLAFRYDKRERWMQKRSY